jgi:DNA-nicking Smr family endonuclease
MSDSGSIRLRRRTRVLTAEERALWKAATQSVAPLGAAAPAPAEPTALAPPPDVPTVPAPVAAIPRSAATSPPALSPLGRRARSRLVRGRDAIDSRLDLHGLTQQRAHGALLRFLRRAQGENAKLVLVITGKGARPQGDHTGERGVLRRLVPQWLELPEFRAYVVGFEPAHIAHGGEGALYVRLRRSREAP